jgi:2,3-bisphosphoglycerate-independent phosphoglycerate mutase
MSDGGLPEGGRLADIAPTLPALMGLPEPAEMRGASLISGTSVSGHGAKAAD